MRPTATLVAVMLMATLPVAHRAPGEPRDPVAPRLVSVAHAETLAVFSRGSAASGVSASAGSPTVVLLPGPLGSAFSMRHITDALAQSNVPTIVIDPLGMGISSKTQRADYTLSAQGRRVRAVLDSLHIGNVMLVGLGTSATVAMHLAADDPARVIAVLSLAGGPVDRQGSNTVKTALKFAPLLDNAIGRSIGRRKFIGGMRDQSFSDVWLTKDVVQAYLKPFERDMRGSLRAISAMSDAVEPTPIATRLPAIRATVRLLVGEKKSTNAPTDEQIALLRQSVTLFHVDTVPRAGTMLNEERPEVVVQVIREILAQHAAVSPSNVAPYRVSSRAR